MDGAPGSGWLSSSAGIAGIREVTFPDGRTSDSTRETIGSMDGSTPASTRPDRTRTPDLTRALPGATFALAVLFGMNLLNYMDRSVFYAVGPDIIRDLHLKNDLRFGLLASAFIVVYTLVSPLFGWMGDRYSRRWLLAAGVALWSLATVGTAFATSYHQMFVWRALLGIGEASYGIVAPTLLADLFPVRQRGRVMGAFYLALPIGSALGFGLGGILGAHFGWRAAFCVVGLPGLLVAGLSLAIVDPGRGALDGFTNDHQLDRPRIRDYLELFRVRSYLYNCFGLAAVTFTTGALYVWGPTFYQRVRLMKLEQANTNIGILLGTASIIGIILGTAISERMVRINRGAYLLWAGLAVLLAIPFGLFAVLDPDPRTSLGLMFLAMILMASISGPCNTVPANVIHPNMRAAAYAMNIFLLHILGDICSPNVIAALSDYLGKPRAVHSLAGRLLEVDRRRSRERDVADRRGAIDQPDRRHASGHPRAGRGRRLLPARRPPPPGRSGSRARRPQGRAKGGHLGWEQRPGGTAEDVTSTRPRTKHKGDTVATLPGYRAGDVLGATGSALGTRAGRPRTRVPKAEPVAPKTVRASQPKPTRYPRDSLTKAAQFHGTVARALFWYQVDSGSVTLLSWRHRLQYRPGWFAGPGAVPICGSMIPWKKAPSRKSGSSAPPRSTIMVMRADQRRAGPGCIPRPSRRRCSR